MCAFSIRDEPPPEPRKTPTTEGRPTTGSTTEPWRPARRSHEATRGPSPASPPPDGTRSGFTEGIATSAQISSSSSSRTVHPKRMQTIEREAEPAPAAKPTGLRQFQPNEIFKQAVISSLAVAPDASSIVYVKRTVDDGKYVRRLWRTTFKGGRPDQLTSATASDTRPRFSPDGKALLFISDRSGKPQVWVMPMTGGEPQKLTDLPSGVGAAEWSPDGQRLLLLAASGEKRFVIGKSDDPAARRITHYTWRLDAAGYRDGKGRLASGRDLNLTNGTYGDFQDGDVLGPPPLQIIDEDNILALVAHKGETHPYRFGVRGDVEALAQPEATCVAIATGGGKIAVAASAGGPTEVYAVEKGNLRPLTVDGGRWFVPFKRQIERIAIQHPAGHTIDTWLMTAKGNRTKAPLVLDGHGGPNASFGPTPRLEMKALAAAGVPGVWCSPPGSGGL